MKHPDSDIYINHAVEIDKQIAWTMAVVLRQALADVLGIASDDTVLQLSQQHCQIVLMQWQPSLFMMCAVVAVVFHVQPRPIFSKYLLKRVIIWIVLVKTFAKTAYWVLIPVFVWIT